MATAAYEVWVLMGQLIKSQIESERLFQKSKQETIRQLKELDKKTGRLYNKFGSYIEGLTLPSMDRRIFSS